MPYITKKEREAYTDEMMFLIEEIFGKLPEDKLEGHLNYFITYMLKRLYKPSYYNYNKVIGLLECIKLEYYRRVVSEYEDIKRDINGEV